jgi:hypothetical protein
MPATVIRRSRPPAQPERDENIARIAGHAAELTLSHLAVVNRLHGLLDDDARFDELRDELGEVLRAQLHKADIRALVRCGR